MDHDSRYTRGLDARLNRLGEALRTIEDHLRFDRALPGLPARWKALRRRLGALRRELETRSGDLALGRDVRGDPGAPLLRPADEPVAQRRDPDDLLRANLARAREAARSLEEVLAAAAPDLTAVAEQLRYDIYSAEAATSGLLRRVRRLADVRLYVLVTSALASCPIHDCVAAAIRGGAQMVQLREKELPAGRFLRLARELREITAGLGALFIINDHVDIAALSGADGVHQGQDDLPPAEARRILGPDAIIGVSTHAPGDARRAEEDGADYIGVGPIFPTRTKEHRAAVGLDFIPAAAAACALPGFAIGSVNRETLDRVLAAGARRVAVCTGIIGCDDVEGAARWFRERLDASSRS